MKKTVFLLALCVIFSISAFADGVHFAGYYYNSDIVAFLDGAPVESINIGGSTCISAEAMKNYGFSVKWDSDSRILNINCENKDTLPEPAFEPKRDIKSGTVAGKYYHTDIITYLDWKEIASFNTGGKTYILAEQMKEFGYKVIWNAQSRTLDIISPKKAGYEYTLNLVEGKANSDASSGSFTIDIKGNNTVISGDGEYFNAFLSLYRGQYAVSMQFYQYQSLFSSEKLITKLNALKCSDVYGSVPCEEKHIETAESIVFMINGKRAENICIMRSQGNGHVDFRFTFDSIELFTKEEIKSIYFELK